MLLFAVALYSEAAPLIEILRLKKDPAFRPFDLFTSKDAALILTGCGPAKAAAGTACLLTAKPPDVSGLFVNFGICGCLTRSVTPGTPYLACRITDAADGRTYYPDLMYPSPFAEAGITSYPQPVRDSSLLPRLEEYPRPAGTCANPGRAEEKSDRDSRMSQTILFDTEAAACYQSASHFLMQHQMIFCKVVSDYGASVRLTPGEVTDLMTQPAKSLITWLSGLSIPKLHTDPFTPKDWEAIQTAAQRLKLSEAMRAQLVRLLTYASLTGHSPVRLLAPFTAPGFACTSKKEGKIYLEQLKYTLSGRTGL